MRARTTLLALLGTSALALAACDDSDGPDVTRGIDTLGDGFVEAFDRDVNDEPVDVDTVSLTVDPTGEPFDVR